MISLNICFLAPGYFSHPDRLPRQCVNPFRYFLRSWWWGGNCSWVFWIFLWRQAVKISPAAHSGSSCSPWWHHWLQQMGTLPAASHASHGVPCHGHGAMAIHGPFPSLPTFQSPVRLALGVGGMILQFEMLSTPESGRPEDPGTAGQILFCSLRGKDASYVQTGLTQVSQPGQWYQDWWKETQTINWSQAHFANPSSSTNQVKLRCFFMIFVQTALSHQSLRKWVPKVELIVWALTANTYSRASRSKINKQLLHGLGCLLSLTSKLELEMEKCKINNRVLPLHIRIVSLPSSNLEGHFGLSGKCHILFIWPCHSEIMQCKSSMSLWWCSQHTCPEMGVYMVYP